MIARKTRLAILVASAPFLVSACVTAPASLATSSYVTQSLQMISAGHTGCQPADNTISNIQMGLNGSGIWNATCNGKTYLCSAFQGVNPSESYSCALAVDKSDDNRQ